MESLGTKIDRLSPEMRKEVEDFVDFLLFRSDQVSAHDTVPLPSQPGQNVAPPPLTLIEPVHVAESAGSRPAGVSPGGSRQESMREPPISTDTYEVGGSSDDRITHDYMDYGQFEQPPSPATEAVKKVKARLNRSMEADRTSHLLDWID